MLNSSTLVDDPLIRKVGSFWQWRMMQIRLGRAGHRKGPAIALGVTPFSSSPARRDRRRLGQRVDCDGLLDRADVVGVEARGEPTRRKRTQALDAQNVRPTHQPDREFACRRFENEQISRAVAIVVC